jgi:hypothetical protein
MIYFLLGEASLRVTTSRETTANEFCPDNEKENA